MSSAEVLVSDMSFLSAAFLLALPLIAVPIAIHFYRGRRRDVVLWGAMQFLAAAVTKGRRWERLEELLLMALRLAAVAALVLALARPMIRSSWLNVVELAYSVVTCQWPMPAQT